VKDLDELTRLREEWSIPLRRVGEHLPISYRTVLRWKKTGQLATRRVGGRVYTSAAALLAACPIDVAHAAHATRDGEAKAATERVKAMLAGRRT